MVPNIYPGIVVWHKGNRQRYVIEQFVIDKTRDEGMVLYRDRNGRFYVRTVEDFKDRFYMEHGG